MYMLFIASRNEVECSVARPDRYRVYRLFDFRRRPGMYMLPGSLRETCRLDPRTFLACAV